MKKYLKWMIGFIVVCGLFSACTNEETDTTNTADTSTSNTSNTTEETVTEEAVKEENKSKIEAGMYKVGTDIPAGEYKVILTSITGMGYLEVSTNSRHTLDTIVSNENVTADTYITVKDGQYLTLSGLNIQK